MDNSKIKSYIILLLLIVNVCLLSIVIRNAAQERAAGEYGSAALEGVLESNGITMADNVVLPEKLPTEVTLSRSMLKERSKLSSLIGSCSAQDLGGNIVSYTGSSGHASYQGTGEFEILLETSSYTGAADPMEQCTSVARKLGIECADIPPEESEDGGLSITVITAWNGTPVYNAPVRFDFYDNQLYSISGMRPLDTEVSVRQLDEYPDAATVIMSFLAYIRQTNAVFSEITDVELGYFISSSVSGNCVLRPVWCIETDTGRYFFNGQTGKPENLEYAA